MVNLCEKKFGTLAGSLFTLHCSQIHIDLPTLSDEVSMLQHIARTVLLLCYIARVLLTHTACSFLCIVWLFEECSVFCFLLCTLKKWIMQ